MLRGLIAATVCAAVSFVALAPPAVPSPQKRQAGAASNGAQTPTPSPSLSPKSITINVAVFRPVGVKNAGDGDPYTELAKKLRDLTPVQAYVVGDPCPYGASACKVEEAKIYVYAKQNPPSDADGGDKGSLTYTSFFVSGGGVQRIADTTVQLGDKGVVPSPKDPEVKSLVGSLTFDENFDLTLNLPETEQTLQLVPVPVNATDPDFEPILEHILETRGIAARRSRFTANALHGPRDAVTCPGAQRYLVYRVRLAQSQKKLQAATIVSAYAEGFILDCVEPAFVPTATGEHQKRLPHTSDLLHDVAALLVALKPKASTAAMTGGIANFSTLVDVDPRDVQEEQASLALAEMTNRMCDHLREYEFGPSPAPSATPTPTPTPRPSGSPLVKPTPIARVPLRCSPWARRQATPPPTPSPLGGPSRTAASESGWFDTLMGTGRRPGAAPSAAPK